MKLDVHIIDIVVTSCHYCFASPRWQGESVNGEGQHWSHLTCLFLTGVIELPQYDCQGKRSQSRTKKKSKLRTACLTPNASSLYFFRIYLCLIHFRFIFVSFHVFFAIFSRTQRETQPVGSPEAMGATLAGDKSSSSDDAETSEQKPFPKPFTSISSI